MREYRYFIYFIARRWRLPLSRWLFPRACTCQMVSSHPIRGTEDIRVIESEIEEDMGFRDVMILYWRRFEAEPDEPIK